jgi:hypothetical protein
MGTVVSGNDDGNQWAFGGHGNHLLRKSKIGKKLRFKRESKN